ncbi:MAG: tripartite tricarboxylate transporter substrate-binding protein [Betaproteobacteria bacterium]
MIRRLFLMAMLAAGIVPGRPGFAADDAWPQKTVRIVVAAPAGSSVDIVARVIAEGLRARWKQAIVVDNKPAAGGTTGAAEVARAAADGYTLFLGYNGPLATASSLYSRPGYDVAADFAPIVLTGSQPNLLVVHPALPVNNLKELIAYAKAHPGKLNYASVGNGSSSHLSMELLKQRTGVDIVHVPFNGGPPATQAVVAGDVQMLFAAPSNLLALVKAGKLKAIATTGRKRFAPTAAISTVAESATPGLEWFEAIAWNGLVAPAATPAAVRQRINADVNAILADPAIQQKLFDAGIEAGGGTEAAFAALIKSETIKWRDVIRVTGATLD